MQIKFINFSDDRQIFNIIEIRMVVRLRAFHISQIEKIKQDRI